MQIHELNTFAGIPGDSNYLAIDNGSDTGKISGTNLLKPVSDRIDNLVASPEGVKTLWTGTSGKAGTTITLSEDVSNFEYLDFYTGTTDTNCFRVPVSKGTAQLQTQNLPDSSGSDFIYLYEIGLSFSGTTVTIAHTTAAIWNTFPGSPTFRYNDNDYFETIKRIDGVKTTGASILELTDIRVGYDGVTYPTAGDAVRGQISDLHDDLSQVYSSRVINTYPESNKANYTALSNTHVYFLSTPLQEGEEVSRIKLYAKSAGTLSLYFCTLDFDANKAYLIEKKDLTCVLGDNDILFNSAFKAESTVYIGLQSTSVLSYRNINTGDWGTVNNPLYETTTSITESGTAFTTGSTAYFRFPIEIKAIKFAIMPDVIADVTPTAVLNNINMLRYKKVPGNYTLWGRWFDLSVNGTTRKVTNNAGSEIMFSVVGATSIEFEFDQATPNTVNPYMAFSIDGGEFSRQQISNNSVTLTLPDSEEHIVRMSVDAISQTDHAYKWNGTNAFALVSITPNAGTMTAIEPMNKIGMFFGDSVTEGINVLGTGDDNTVQSATEAYSYWTARYLNSIRYCIGYGGSGMTQAGSFKPCIDAVNYYKNGVPTGDFYPDYIVINHGINDYSGTAAAFIAAYTIVIDRIRIKYPGVPIFMVYPFMTNSANDKFVSGMEALANSYTNVYFVPTLGWNGATTDGTHLSVAGAKSNADKLSKAILQVLGKSFFI